VDVYCIRETADGLAEKPTSGFGIAIELVMNSDRVGLLDKVEGSNAGRFVHYMVGKSACFNYTRWHDLSATDYIA